MSAYAHRAIAAVRALLPLLVLLAAALPTTAGDNISDPFCGTGGKGSGWSCQVTGSEPDLYYCVHITGQICATLYQDYTYEMQVDDVTCTKPGSNPKNCDWCPPAFQNGCCLSASPPPACD